MKKFILTLILLSNIGFAVTLDEITTPKPLLGNVANTDEVEISKTIEEKKIETITLKEQPKEEETLQDEPITEAQQKEEEDVFSTFADLSLKKLAKDVSQEVNIDENKINSDLSILWNATMERSETMKYTIYKLSNPDEDKPKDSAIKKILRPIASLSSVAGASVSSDPYMATGALIGGGLLNAFMKDDKEFNYKFSKVSDSDMVLLIRKIDELQKKLLDLYIDYKTKEQIALMTQETFVKREEIFNATKNKSREEQVIADVYYRNAKTNAQKANDEYQTARAILENLVGEEALLKIEG